MKPAATWRWRRRFEKAEAPVSSSYPRGGSTFGIAAACGPRCWRTCTKRSTTGLRLIRSCNTHPLIDSPWTLTTCGFEARPVPYFEPCRGSSTPLGREHQRRARRIQRELPYRRQAGKPSRSDEVLARQPAEPIEEAPCRKPGVTLDRDDQFFRVAPMKPNDLDLRRAHTQGNRQGGRRDLDGATPSATTSDARRLLLALGRGPLAQQVLSALGASQAAARRRTDDKAARDACKTARLVATRTALLPTLGQTNPDGSQHPGGGEQLVEKSGPCSRTLSETYMNSMNRHWRAGPYAMT